MPATVESSDPSMFTLNTIQLELSIENVLNTDAQTEGANVGSCISD